MWAAFQFCWLVALGGRNIDPPGRGALPVGMTNMEVASPYAALPTAEMLSYLNRTHPSGLFLSGILKYPDNDGIFEVTVPNIPGLYGDSSGERIEFVAFVAYPTSGENDRGSYVFPYADASDGIFEHMEERDEEPIFHNPNVRYPLIVISHGLSAHGLYDVTTAKTFASNGYIAVSITHGDGSTVRSRNDLYSLRPLAVEALIDKLLASESFGPHIDSHRIGIYGHSFGGMTVLASMGAKMFNHPSAVTDRRIKAGVGLEPSFWRQVNGVWNPLFGTNNHALSQIGKPYMSINGSQYVVGFDEVELVSGTTYGVLLPGQPHIFDGPSWSDAQNWGIIFFDAYLKNEDAKLALLNTANSVSGFNEDEQRFERQNLRPAIPIAREDAFGSNSWFSLKVVGEDGYDYAYVYYPKRVGSTDMYYDLQYSLDSKVWFTLNAPSVVIDSVQSELPELDAGYEWGIFRDPVALLANGESRLYRIRCDKD